MEQTLSGPLLDLLQWHWHSWLQPIWDWAGTVPGNVGFVAGILCTLWLANTVLKSASRILMGLAVVLFGFGGSAALSQWVPGLSDGINDVSGAPGAELFDTKRTRNPPPSEDDEDADRSEPKRQRPDRRKSPRRGK